MDAVSPDFGPTQPIKVSLPLDAVPTQLVPDKLGIFSEGQLIKATVQQISGSVVWLKMDEHLLQARTQIPLQLEQQVRLKVVDVNPLQVNLQLQTSAPQNDSTELETLLTSWGLPADEVNLNIAQALIKHAHSVNPDDIQTVRTLWRTLPASPPSLAATKTGQQVQSEQLEALTYLHTNNLPINKETLASAQRWLSGLSPLTERLAELQLGLDDVLGQLNQFKTASPEIAQLRDTLLSIRTQIDNWLVLPQRPIEAVITSLTHISNQLGTPPEADLASLLLTDGSPGSSADFREQLPQPGPLPVRSMGPDEIISSNALHRLAQVLTKALGQTSLDAPTSQAFHRLVEQSERLTSDLSAMHLSNLTNNQNLAADTYYYLPIPLATLEGPRTAQLKIYRQPGQQRVDPENLRLALLLDLPSLGEIVINLTIFERYLSGQILCGQQQTQHQVEAELGQLHLGLNNLGYCVEALICNLLTKPQAKVQRSTLRGIDVSA